MNKKEFEIFKKYRERKYQADLLQLQADMSENGLIQSGMRPIQEMRLKQDADDEIEMEEERMKEYEERRSDEKKERYNSVRSNRILVAVAIFSFFLTIYTVKDSATINKDNRTFALMEMQPYLSVQEIKFDNNSYIQVSRMNNVVEMKVRFRLSNQGKTVARNIHMSEIFIQSTEKLEVASSTITFVSNTKGDHSPVGSFFLVPGEARDLEVSFKKLFIDRSLIDQKIKNIEEDKDMLPFALEIYYDTELDSCKKKKIGFDMIFKSHSTNLNYKVLEDNCPK